MLDMQKEQMRKMEDLRNEKVLDNIDNIKNMKITLDEDERVIIK